VAYEQRVHACTVRRSNSSTLGCQDSRHSHKGQTGDLLPALQTSADIMMLQLTRAAYSVRGRRQTAFKCTSYKQQVGGELLLRTLTKVARLFCGVLSSV
jgi:hypothetical protein